MSTVDAQRLLETLPGDIARRIERGLPVTLVVVRAGEALEVREIDPTQGWFWTPDWQAGEREADESIRVGNIDRYGSGEDLVRALEDALEQLPD